MLRFFSLPHDVLSDDDAPLHFEGHDDVVSERVVHFEGKNKDLNQLAQQIIEKLSSEGYKIQSTNNPMGIIIQAKKAGVLRDIITAERAFTILISGQPNNFTIHIGIGKFNQNLAVASIEAILTVGLFLIVDIPEMLWTNEVEKGIIKDIIQIVG
jgi:hypothetical protein